jgi:hypothetical protein
MTQQVHPGQAFLVDFINQSLPQHTAARAEAYGQVQALSGNTLPVSSEGQR